MGEAAGRELTGRCLCGAVAFRGRLHERGVWVCHCGQCRRWTGGPVHAARFVEGVELLRDEGLAWFRSSEIAERGFCRHCGAKLFWRRLGEARDWAVSAGALDDPVGLWIGAHIWVEDKPPCYEYADSAPRLPRGSDGGQAASASGEAEKPPVAESPGGGCLCGRVLYVAEGVREGFWACHCATCRRWTSGPMLGVEVARVRFEGEDAITRYRSSSWAERGFCMSCGTALFYRVIEADRWFLSLGAFDDQTRWHMAGEMFIDEKPAWYSFAGERPRLTGAEVFETARRGGLAP